MTAHSLTRRYSAGFTLVELLVALTGGLFISLAVFALSRDSGRFYQSETRLANATVGGLLGFERLRQDIARAGFLISPNASQDTSHLCKLPDATWPVGLQNLASIRVTTPLGSYPSLASNGRTPPALVLAGSYASSDLFAATSYMNGSRIVFQLGNLYPDHPAQPPLLRLGNGTWPTNAAMASVFPVGGGLRIVQNGRQYYGVIDSSTGGTNPLVTVTNVPTIPQLGDPQGCGLNVIGSAASKATINVVNIIRYQLGTPRTVTGIANYQPMYAASNLNDAAPGEAGRTELMRVEQSITGADIDGTEEVVAEYAVDFNLQITAVTSFTGPDPTLAVIPPNSAQFASFTGATYGNPNNMPQRIRSVRVRLGVRSRQGDRSTTLANPTGGGLFRFDLGTGNSEAYARVRTFQADVFLHNQGDVTW